MQAQADGQADQGPKTRIPWTRRPIACTNCRKRKSRCSGQPCEFCIKHGLECVLETLSDPDAQRAPKRRAMRPTTEELVTLKQQSSPTHSSPTRSASFLEAFGPGVMPPASQEEQETETAANAMGQPLSLTLPTSSSKSSPFFGSSSALSFAKLIIAAALPNFTLPPPDLSDGALEFGKASTHSSFVEDAKDLPVRASADRMLENYFHRVHEIFRVLHRPTFSQDYEKVWLSGHHTSTTFLALLNIVFALSCIFTNGICSRESEKYYRRSVQLRKASSDAESVTLTEVQTLLFQCQYLQSTSSATRCWQTLSQAISAAYTLGLNCVPTDTTNAIFRESRLRLWLACRNLDAVIGSTFGRAPQIPLATATLVPFPTETADDDCITATGIQHIENPVEPSPISVFIWSGKIYAIMSKIIHSLYIPVDVRGFQESESSESQTILQIEEELQHIKHSLPSYLAFTPHVNRPAPSDSNDWGLRQKVIIQNRFLRTRALLFRPSLMRALKARTASPIPASAEPTASASTLATATSAAARQLCFECACEQIDLCYATTATQLDAPWYRRFYMCDCLSILLACKILSIGNDVFQQYWQKATHVFHATFETERPSMASHGLHLLEAIRQQLEQAEASSFTFSADLGNLLSTSNVFLASQDYDWLDNYVDYNATILPEWDSMLQYTGTSREETSVAHNATTAWPN